MMYTALLVAAATLASAQYTYNSTTGVFTCPPDNLNGAFCAGESLQTNIIIRCNNGVGQPGNCNDNLAGYFPIGVNYAPCFQTSDTSGDAACSKNCIVEGSSGNYNGTFTISGCTPSSSSAAASSTTSVSTTSGSASTTSSSSGAASTTSSASCSTTTSSASITSTLSSTLSTSTLSPSGGFTSSSNGTITTTSKSATKTVTGPTTSSSSSTFTGAANAMGVNSGAGLAGIGLMIAYFL